MYLCFEAVFWGSVLARVCTDIFLSFVVQFQRSPEHCLKCCWFLILEQQQQQQPHKPQACRLTVLLDAVAMNITSKVRSSSV
jgi:hypothetical protein